ncbi:LLM class F420-dependent oxidoreductase [Actinocorallia populi]|uniref:LLM class F420-dependent oxidoreductase n=1 Tax=Actinocorallia populi TaxID=2079200 RepID=UPI000D09714A|nr:LLM class F420-dependent oxidoreductase [Actinocorallia populi]
MRVGIVSPVVTLMPGTHAEWERSAGIEDLGRIARVADGLGFDHLTCSEHVAVPSEVAEVRGGTYWDPLATFGYLAACTGRIRLATHVLVLGYHHPLEIAKRYGTLDRICGGRLVLGLGVGTLHEEFALLGAEFEGRGRRADDALAALRASLSRREPEHHGEFYEFSGMIVEPHAVQPRVPLWIGGRTPRSLRRAVRFGDGWVPFGLSSDELTGMLAAVGLPEGFEVVLTAEGMLDPIGSPRVIEQKLHSLRAAGATVVDVRISAESPAHYCEQLEALHALVQEIEGIEGNASHD